MIIVLNANQNAELNLGKECREIKNGLNSSENRNKFDVNILCSARTIDIRREILRIKPDFVHICGHSIKNEGVIIEDENHNIQILSGKTLKEFFGIFSNFLHCVLLNSCYSSNIAKEIAEEIEYTIGMKYKIEDEDAVEYAVAFYDGIFSGESIETSFALASNSLKWNKNISYPEPVLNKKIILNQLHSKDTLKQNVKVFSRLPVKNDFFYGRKSEIKLLNNFWDNENVNIVCIEAPGGVGKTALVSKWQSEMINASNKDVEIIFDWSFYSQGNVNNRPVSVDAFFAEAFKCFGIDDVDSVLERGEKLALLLRQKKSLIILDGVEALQYSDNYVGKEGEIKNYSLRVFISMVVNCNRGLCILTTRKQIPSLANCDGERYKLLKLPNFSLDESIDFIKNYKLLGKNEDLEEICSNYDGHALSLSLIATYIRDAFECSADKFLTEINDTTNLDNIIKILGYHETWLGNGIQLRILRLLSLFDRPAKQDELNFLLAGYEIQGLTDGLKKLSSNEFGNSIRQLKHLSLVMHYEMDNITYLDTHPIVREYFSRDLEKQHKSAYKQGHYRLFKYFSNSAEQCYVIINSMNLWFRAMYHGCHAECYAEVFENIYLPHIKQGELVYDARMLGGNGTNLEAISGFFSEPWIKIRGNLDDHIKSNIYAEASFALRSKGLITEAIVPLEKAFKIEKCRHNYEEAAMEAGNISELYLVIGKMNEALKYVDEGLFIAEKSNRVWRHYWIQLAKKADILSKIGKSNFAIAYFRQAESVQKFFDAESQRLYGVLAFKKFDAYLTEYEEKILIPKRLQFNISLNEREKKECVKQLSEYEKQVLIALEHDLKYKRLLHIALDNLVIARIKILKYLVQEHIFDSNLYYYLSSSVDGLYQSGREEYIPYGLIISSKYWNLQGNTKKMNENILKAEDIIKSKGFKIFEIDIAIENSYLYILNKKKGVAKQLLEITKMQCIEINYNRRINEIDSIIEKIS